MNLNETIFYISSTFEIKINNIISFKKAQDEKETQQSSVVWWRADAYRSGHFFWNSWHSQEKADYRFAVLWQCRCKKAAEYQRQYFIQNPEITEYSVHKNRKENILSEIVFQYCPQKMRVFLCLSLAGLNTRFCWIILPFLCHPEREAAEGFLFYYNNLLFWFLSAIASCKLCRFRRYKM